MNAVKQLKADLSYTVEEMQYILAVAEDYAYRAACDYERNVLAGRMDACGFAWTIIDGIKGSTKVGRTLKKAGVGQDYLRRFQVWNPSKYPTQNISTLEAGARAAAEVFKSYGFDAYCGSRMD